MIIDSDNSSDDIIEVSSEATDEDTSVNKDCNYFQDFLSTQLGHPINPVRPNDFSSYVGQRLSDQERPNAITNILSQTKILTFHHIQNMGKSDHLFILGLILSNGWSTLHLRMVFIVWHVYSLVTPQLIKIALNLRDCHGEGSNHILDNSLLKTQEA